MLLQIQITARCLMEGEFNSINHIRIKMDNMRCISVVPNTRNSIRYWNRNGVTLMVVWRQVQVYFVIRILFGGTKYPFVKDSIKDSYDFAEQSSTHWDARTTCHLCGKWFHVASSWYEERPSQFIFIFTHVCDCDIQEGETLPRDTNYLKFKDRIVDRRLVFGDP